MPSLTNLAPLRQLGTAARGAARPSGRIRGRRVGDAMRFTTEIKVLPASVSIARSMRRLSTLKKPRAASPARKSAASSRTRPSWTRCPWSSLAACGYGSTCRPVYPGPGHKCQSRADEIVTLLVEGLPGFAVTLVDTQTSPQAAMAHCLITQEPPAGFTAGLEAELKACDESQAVVSCTHRPLDIGEVRQHIKHGKLPSRLAMDQGGPGELRACRRLPDQGHRAAGCGDGWQQPGRRG